MLSKKLIVFLTIITLPFTAQAEGRSLIFSEDPVILVEEIQASSTAENSTYWQVILSEVKINPDNECWLPLNAKKGNYPAYETVMGLTRKISVKTETDDVPVTIDQMHSLADIVCWGN